MADEIGEKSRGQTVKELVILRNQYLDLWPVGIFAGFAVRKHGLGQRQEAAATPILTTMMKAPEEAVV